MSGNMRALSCHLHADAFAQEFIATLWTFSMRAVDVGALLLSAWPEKVVQRRHCRVKDWRYSQAVYISLPVCDFVLSC